ncbi:MAG: hypothetical protein AAF479_07725 [Pseudomonadota bacterium]
MTPADIVKADRLCDAVCHSDQMNIWSSELLMHIEEFLPPMMEHADSIDLHRQVQIGIRSILESAFAHPEIMGMPERQGGACD